MGFEAFLDFVSFALAERGPPHLRNAAGFGSAFATQSQLLSLARAVATVKARSDVENPFAADVLHLADP